MAQETFSAAAFQPIEIAGGGLRARFLAYGATLHDLRLDGVDHPLVLGLKNPEDYPRYTQHYGAICGRIANRVRDAHLPLKEKTYQLDKNFKDRHCLHGGTGGYSRREWAIDEHGTDFVRFLLKDQDKNGLPGTLVVRATYRLQEKGTLALDITAQSDQPTVCNLAHHSYFVLDDRRDIRDHLFTIKADSYLPVDDDLIPNGAISPVSKPFDFYNFSSPRALRSVTSWGHFIDHNYCLSSRREKIRPVVTVKSPHSNISLHIATTEPGLQFYGGHNINSQVPGLTGTAYGPYAGFCLEPQFWPDAVHHPHFPDIELAAGEIWHQQNQFIFSKDI